MVEEESFPRGGIVIRKRPPQENESLFSLTKPPKAKKPKKSKKQDYKQSSDDAFHSTLNIQGSLTYSKIQTGMVILGCVKNIKNIAIGIELPGLCCASVSITEISDPFTKLLNEQLENNETDTNAILKTMFSLGDFVPVKIINIEARDNGSRVLGSINPREIYADHNHNSFKKHMLVWSSIGSQGDHGCEMNMGVKNCRAFLPSKNVDQGSDLLFGRPVWCVVHKVDSSATASTLRLSAKAEHIKSAKLDIENIHELIPGMKVEFLTDKINAHGIQGKISDNFICYVDENFLGKPLKKPPDYHEGKILNAYVLFVEHTTKITHLTLRFPERNEKPSDINVGDIVKAEVLNKSSNGVFFVLPNNLKGFTTNRRIINTLGKKDNINIAEAISNKYSIGSGHQCRIIDYNYLTKTFICTPELDVVKESIFLPSDLTHGQLVTVQIVTIKDEGIVITAGHVRGFVTNMHISNIEYTNKVKKKFKEGQKVNARVLSIEGEKVLFTLKPALVEQEGCLTKIEDAEIGLKYLGVVSKLTESSAMIVFYNNIKGWLNLQGMRNETTEPSKYFFLGQVVNIYVWKSESGRLSLSLFHPQVKPDLLNVGGRHCGIVTLINKNGVVVQIGHRKGFIPNAHLSSTLSLCLAVKNTFSIGDKIPELTYVGGIRPQIYSRREGLALKTMPRLVNLNSGDVIRCSYQNASDQGIYVTPLIQDCIGSVLVTTEDVKKHEFVEHQLVMAKITKLNRKERKVNLSIDDVFDRRVETTIDVFSQYLLELSYLYRYGKTNKWPICKYHPGNRVDCTVEKVSPEGGCLVSLPNDVKGLVVPSLCPKTIKEGDQLTGVVIGRDYDRQFLDICLKPDIWGKINTIQDANIKGPVTSSIAEKLLVKDDCVIALLRHANGNKQLVYLPAKLHENDFEQCMSYYDKKTFKACVCGKIKKFLIGMSKRLFLHLDKATKKNRLAVKTEASESDCGTEPEETNEVEVEIQPENEQPMANVSQKPVSLPGVSSFFNDKRQPPAEDSSSEDDEDNGPIEKKKKKLSPSERAELLKQEEERLSKIEQELANPTKVPESAEQFDRILLAKPNSAELWAKYIALYIATTEIDKARAVAKRALDTINMTLTDEKFKIWVVLLNLENMLGTKESFDKVFEDALKFNDSLQVYLKTIELLAESAKYNEMEEKINKVRAKHKQDSTMWLEVAKTYYQIGKFKEARNCKDRALKTITDKKSQMNIIVRFAIMEFKHGEQDHGCAIFETILTTDPRKINVWSIYVDQLVKKGLVDEARQVLNRAVCHRLPLKSMKSLFMKFRKFEEEHGTLETINAVKQRAQDYVIRFEK